MRSFCRLLITVTLTLAACGSSTSPSPSLAQESPPATSTPEAMALSSSFTSAYGEAPQQFGELSLPDAEGPLPVVVFIHGGFWRAQFEADLMEPLRDSAVAAGYAVWNIEYRRVGQDGGGWPGTLDDVGAAVDHLAELATDQPLDLDRVAVVGHSAGGQLAVWTAGRGDLASDAPGANPVVRPTLVVGQAPVLDLVNGANDGVGGGAIQAFLGGEPTEVPDRYEIAGPECNCSYETRVVLVHGVNDANVPLAYGNVDELDAEQWVYEDTDHFDVIDPAHESWIFTLGVLAEM